MMLSHVASVAMAECLHALQVALTVHVAMTAYQSVIYDWVKATGTLRLSPYDPRIGKSHRHNFAPLNNKCMELRKVTPSYTMPQQCSQHTYTYAPLHQKCTMTCTVYRIGVLIVQPLERDSGHIGQIFTYFPSTGPLPCHVGACSTFALWAHADYLFSVLHLRPNYFAILLLFLFSNKLDLSMSPS